MEYAPIVISVYDRLDHLKRCVASLQKNKLAGKSVLYIVSDAAYSPEHIDRILLVRRYISFITGFKEVRPILREKNLGASKSILSLLNEVLKEYDTFIFLEDDIVVSSDFLEYMNEGLTYYRNQKQIFGICGFKLPFELPKGYSQDIYFYPCNSPWGFATWKERWEAVDHGYFDRYAELSKDKGKYKAFYSIGFYIKGILQADSRKEIVAGDLRVYYYMFQHGMCSVFPVVSKTQNWGFDGTGEHCGNKNAWWTKPELNMKEQSTQFVPFEGYNRELLKKHQRFQNKINGGLIAKHFKYTWLHRLYVKFKNRMK